MKLKTIYVITTLACLFTLTSNVNLEARHKRHTTYVEVVNQNYVANTYYPNQYVVSHYYPETVYVRQTAPVYVAQPVQTVIVRQEPVVYKERVVVKERSSPIGLLTSFALGLGIGLCR